MHQTLIIFAHPYPVRSRVNRVLLQAVRDLDGVSVCDLYERYPDFYIDVEHEQQALCEANLIVFQHPFYWYSVPGLLKHWMDTVLEYGFAYGSDGRQALHGKSLLQVVSTGHREEAYCAQGEDRYPVKELLRPVKQTARHCGMTYQSPLVFYGARTLQDAQIQQHAQTYRQKLQQLQASAGAAP